MISSKFLKDSQILVGILVAVLGVSASGITFYWVGRKQAEIVDATTELRLATLERKVDVLATELKHSQDDINKRIDAKFDTIDNRLLFIEKSIVRIEQQLFTNGVK